MYDFIDHRSYGVHIIICARFAISFHYVGICEAIRFTNSLIYSFWQGNNFLHFSPIWNCTLIHITHMRAHTMCWFARWCLFVQTLSAWPAYARKICIWLCKISDVCIVRLKRAIMFAICALDEPYHDPAFNIISVQIRNYDSVSLPILLHLDLHN